jgi:hypothetical protein
MLNFEASQVRGFLDQPIENTDQLKKDASKRSLLQSLLYLLDIFQIILWCSPLQDSRISKPLLCKPLRRLFLMHSWKLKNSGPWIYYPEGLWSETAFRWNENFKLFLLFKLNSSHSFWPHITIQFLAIHLTWHRTKVYKFNCDQMEWNASWVSTNACSVLHWCVLYRRWIAALTAPRLKRNRISVTTALSILWNKPCLSLKLWKIYE